jgi:hypothetical protein
MTMEQNNETMSASLSPIAGDAAFTQQIVDARQRAQESRNLQGG